MISIMVVGQIANTLSVIIIITYYLTLLQQNLEKSFCDLMSFMTDYHHMQAVGYIHDMSKKRESIVFRFVKFMCEILLYCSYFN